MTITVQLIPVCPAGDAHGHLLLALLPFCRTHLSDAFTYWNKVQFCTPPPLHFLNVALIIILIFSNSPADLLYSLKFTPFHLPLHILKTFSHSISSSSLPLDPTPSLSHVPCPVLSIQLTMIFLSSLFFYTKHESIAFFWSVCKFLPYYTGSPVGRLLHCCENLSIHI